MLGTLGKWLRLLGYDTVTATDQPDAVLVRQARAEGRLILTRDRELARRRGVDALLIADDDLDAQLAQVVRELRLVAPRPGSRCPHCNELLLSVTREDVADAVPPYVLRSHEQFRRCPACGQVYWRGSHWPQVEARLGLWE